MRTFQLKYLTFCLMLLVGIPKAFSQQKPDSSRQLQHVREMAASLGINEPQARQLSRLIKANTVAMHDLSVNATLPGDTIRKLTQKTSMELRLKIFSMLTPEQRVKYITYERQMQIKIAAHHDSLLLRSLYQFQHPVKGGHAKNKCVI